MILGVLADFQKVARAVGYHTAWDASIRRFRIVGPDGMIPGCHYSTRLGAHNAAEALAKITFISQDEGNMLDKARSILSNDVIEEIGEENLFNGPLYEREEENEEAAD